MASGGRWCDALQMLCTAELLTRQDVAETFGAESAAARRFLRALGHVGLGNYYLLRGKPRAALRFLEQAANGHAKWVHPAVLMNLSATHLLLKEPGRAVPYLAEAILALRSAAGPLCPRAFEEVEAAESAASAAVATVLGQGAAAVRAGQVPSDVGRKLSTMSSSLRVEPGSLLGAEATIESQAQCSQLRGLGRFGLVRKESGQEISWSTRWTAQWCGRCWWQRSCCGPGRSLERCNRRRRRRRARATRATRATREALQGMARPGIAKHAAKLKKAWREWGKVCTLPGAGLVLRESLLLCALHGACALAQLSSQPVYGLWALPPLREGLVLAIVLFGSKHPLALKLVNACQRLQGRPSREDGQGSEPKPALPARQGSARCKPKVSKPKPEPRPKTAAAFRDRSAARCPPGTRVLESSFQQALTLERLMAWPPDEPARARRPRRPRRPRSGHVRGGPSRR
ncbi:unnamed protein product [Effrenium voratum]|nr:unnamed protein product [Effrenium voratum]